MNRSDKLTIEEEVAAPTDAVKKAAADAKEAVKAACDDAKKQESETGGANAEANQVEAEAAVEAEKQRKEEILEAQEKGVKSVAAAKKIAESTQIKLQEHQESLDAAQNMESGCQDKNGGKHSGDATGSPGQVEAA